jgi:hypothetical protein
MVDRWKVRKAQPDDIKGMLDLNYKIYPPEWHVSVEYVEQIMKRNPQVYNVLRTEEGIKGIFSLFPLSKEHYEQVLYGTLEENRLAEYLLDYTTPKDVYLYFISIIVDVFDPKRKMYAREIIKSIPEELKRIEEIGMNIQEIGAIAISPEGKQILPKIGFHQDESPIAVYEQEFPVFRAAAPDVLKAIRN